MIARIARITITDGNGTVLTLPLLPDGALSIDVNARPFIGLSHEGEQISVGCWPDGEGWKMLLGRRI